MFLNTIYSVSLKNLETELQLFIQMTFGIINICEITGYWRHKLFSHHLRPAI